MKRPALILICLLLQACSATTKELGNSLWDSLFGTPGVQLTDDDIQNMPYASQYMQLNGGPQLFVVLAFAEDGELTRRLEDLAAAGSPEDSYSAAAAKLKLWALKFLLTRQKNVPLKWLHHLKWKLKQLNMAFPAVCLKVVLTLNYVTLKKAQQTISTALTICPTAL